MSTKKSTRRLEVWCNDAVCVYEFPPHLCKVLDQHGTTDEEQAPARRGKHHHGWGKIYYRSLKRDKQ